MLSCNLKKEKERERWKAFQLLGEDANCWFIGLDKKKISEIHDSELPQILLGSKIGS